MKKKMWVVTGLALAAGLGFAAWLGAFRGIKVEEKELGPWVLAGKAEQGPFHRIGGVIAQVEQAAPGFKDGPRFGLFPDDPAKVPASSLRWEAGLARPALDAKARKELSSAGLTVTDWKRQRCLAAEFPYRNGFSFALGPMKVYPALRRAMGTELKPAGPALEIYERDRIVYAFPVKPAAAP